MELAKETAWQRLINLIDIFLVAYVNYRILALVRGTRAWRIVWGATVFAALLVVSSILRLETLNWLLEKAAILVPVALVILLLPELRQAVENVGKVSGGWAEGLLFENRQFEVQAVEEIVAATAEMSAGQVGALIILERSSPLSEIIATGVQLDARLSAPLLGAIFQKGNPLHDGAVVIRGSTIVAAACQLPLSDNQQLDATFHMRHRAAIGLSERYDAIAIVVSEERGTVSVAMDGQIQRLGNPSELRDIFKQGLRPEPIEKRRKAFARARQAK